MKKEIGIAIFCGVLFGLVVAAIMISRIRTMENRRGLPGEAQISPTVKNLNSQLQTLEISEPSDLAMVSQKSIKIRGKTVKDSLIVIQSPIKDILLNNKNETFSADVPLALGENVIVVASHPKGSSQSSQEKTIKVYYLDEN